MSHKFLKVEYNESIAIITICREDKLNALSIEVIRELLTAFSELNHIETLRGIILIGAGDKAFIAGADIKAMTKMNEDEAKEFSQLGQELTLVMEKHSLPIIACVNGYALGGGLEVALASDIIYASSNALFALPEVSLGLIPGFGGTQRLAKIIGRAKAKELIYTAQRINAQEAYDLNLIQSIQPTREDLINKAFDTFEKIQKNSPLAIKLAKKSLNEGVDLNNSLGMNIESENFAILFNSYDMQEGTRAFLDKRSANFLGK